MAKTADLTKLVGDIGIGNGLFPDKQGPRCLTYSDTLAAADPYEIDLTMVEVRGFVTSIQTVWIDNSAGASVLTLECASTQQIIRCPAGVSAFYSVLLSRETPKVTVQRADAGAFKVIFLNTAIPSTPSDLAALITLLSNATAGAPTSVTAAVTDTLLLAANANRRGYRVYNDSASARLYLLESASAASATVFTTILNPADVWISNGYAGAVRGIWSAAVGAARITELT